MLVGEVSVGWGELLGPLRSVEQQGAPCWSPPRSAHFQDTEEEVFDCITRGSPIPPLSVGGKASSLFRR